MSAMIDAWIEAAVQAGHGLNADFNGARQVGFGSHQPHEPLTMTPATVVDLRALTLAPRGRRVA